MQHSADFYILENQDAQARFLFACRLADKAYQNKNTVLLFVDSAAEAQLLDDMLWTFRDISFIPHEICYESNDDAHIVAPVRISHTDCPKEKNDILVILSTQLPTFTSQFSRVMNIISSDSYWREIGRQHYRQLRDLGFELTSHTMTK